ncbi:pleiotropic drug resistance protein 3-like [Gossypium australe]|uniref:Pleiotropic drug resistance protein 3-like n=1 Tax=Gossypium australe TaxID=47621 RepID=A0A5B6VJW1_9ROSI|nr:pleiotropic drug resistance protein 3-like [Gossypium australe]
MGVDIFSCSLMTVPSIAGSGLIMEPSTPQISSKTILKQLRSFTNSPTFTLHSRMEYARGRIEQ